MGQKQITRLVKVNDCSFLMAFSEKDGIFAAETN